MINKRWIGLIFLFMANMPLYAFTTVDEQIDSYLETLATGNYESKKQMLERLVWSGLSDPRLFDEIEKQLNAKYRYEQYDKYATNLLSHQARALGFSGNDKYRDSLEWVKKSAFSRKVRNHANKALKELGIHENWNRMIAEIDLTVEGKSVEVTTYMKMLNVDDTFVQRQAARATYHELRQDPDLLALFALKLEGMYLLNNLDKQEQDTGAWFCKALGRNGGSEYTALLSKVARDTPHKKIRRYASKYTH
jgi:hypothetical protein